MLGYINSRQFSVGSDQYTQSVLNLGEAATLDNLRFPGQGCSSNQKECIEIHDFCEKAQPTKHKFKT